MSDGVPGTDEDRSTLDTAADGIRTASEADLPRLLAIQAAAFPDPHRTLLRSGVRAGLALVALDGPVAPDEVTVPGNDVAGYALFTVDEASVYVAELAVAPGHRRRGHGHRLLAAVAARHPGRDQLRLTTRVDNEDARAFYASLGFREVRELPGHYGGSEGSDEDGADWSETDLRRSSESDTSPPERGDPTDGVLLVRDIE